ncbi:MAG: hypothetical protein ACTSXO_01075 [Candidatus Heimdallarchaeota archaeon]
MAISTITGSGMALLFGTNAEVMTVMALSGLSFDQAGVHVSAPSPGSLVVVVPKDL